jgi:hypothetical protein
MASSLVGRVYQIREVRVFECASEGDLFRTDQDTLGVIGTALEHDARLVVVPAARLSAEFFDLRTGRAGELVQKFVNYHLRLAVLGDVSVHTSQSRAFGDFVAESNRGQTVWFLARRDDLEKRLGSIAG